MDEDKYVMEESNTITIPFWRVLKAPKIGSTTRGIPTRSGPWLVAPYPFGIAGLTGEMGPVSQFSVCVQERWVFLC